MNNTNLNEMRDIFQDCNINFLIGSGLSAPYLEILGDIEILLAALAEQRIEEKKEKIIAASLYKKYFDRVIVKNIDILNGSLDINEVLNGYKKLLQSINSILLNRRSTILSKQVNIFTTNIDVFLEKALEDIGLEYNDGFCGRFLPTFNLSNFKKSTFRKSLHYDNTSEIPVFNLLKLHGSLTWETDAATGKIRFSPSLSLVKQIKDQQIPSTGIIDIPENSKIETLISEAEKIADGSTNEPFLEIYKKLLIVNPTKEKFKHTLFNQAYYDLLRIYSNELEKENTVLFVMGFSFADEHIRDLTIRAANSNPTLTIYIVAHTFASKTKYEQMIDFGSVKNSNIRILVPPRVKPPAGEGEVDEFVFNLQRINERIFDELLKKIEEQKIPVNTYI